MSLAPSRTHPERPILAASVAVVREGRVLLAQRVNPPSAGCFSLPGGLVEVGEALEDAALRELAEETGVRARVTGFNGHVEVIARDGDDRVAHHFVVASFVAEWVSGEPVASPEVGAVLWADPRHLGDLPLTPGLRPLLDRAVTLVERSRGDAA